MSKVKSNTQNRRYKVSFSIEAVDAGAVALVGTFNNWNPRKHPMQRSAAGSWQRSVMLPPGAHEYKFLVDGNWREDPQNSESLPNTFGTRNSVLHVVPKP